MTEPNVPKSGVRVAIEFRLGALNLADRSQTAWHNLGLVRGIRHTRIHTQRATLRKLTRTS